MNPLLRWYHRHARDLPWRTTHDPYAIWISEVMLQQTQVKTVVPYWRRWMTALPTVNDLADASDQQLLKHWEGLGYYSRVRNLKKAALMIRDEFKGIFPQNISDWRQLPGVGQYTAAAICSIAFNHPEPVVDGNVRRVLSRLHAIRGFRSTSDLDKKLCRIAGSLIRHVPATGDRCEHRFGDWNQALMELGATVCIPRNPGCTACPITQHCRAFEKGDFSRFPSTAPAKPPVLRHCLVLAVEHRGQWLVRQRPAHGINAGYWEFPNIETHSRCPIQDGQVLNALGFIPAWLEPFLSLSHAITRYRFQVSVFRGALLNEPPVQGLDDRWVSLSEAEQLPLTGAHRKILRRLLACS
ncbi:MAG TPA: A/G-specific adenine glycosylase [Candidatus Paceibacterota bacterium]|nr:A/G-specific adenine glycosylase [Verrucomicrobiota bacterium]HRY48503.1 A/G-specific adenine glycosylase [Candidatus Paceibacterota bacterium]HRZ99670.1 A/G-specific adenine glycosylase [Candidatus Paceibacterota bacterium]